MPSLSRWAAVPAASLLLALVAVPVQTVPVLAAAPGTVVSLTFDDGLENQFDNARPILDAHGMDGTFYINSGRVGMRGYMSRAQLRTLASGGHEIGGHTIEHKNVPSLSLRKQRRQVCGDRVALLKMGFAVTSFAYPFGAQDPRARDVARYCGYNSARTVGGIVSPTGCDGCARAEAIPPAARYSVRTPGSVKTSTTMAQLKGYVTQAEQSGGGWVPLVFHHVCNDCGNAYRVTPATLDAFLDWLGHRSSRGTVVRTVHEVVGGGVQPPVPGPSSRTRVRNPSLEAASNGVPG